MAKNVLRRAYAIALAASIGAGILPQGSFAATSEIDDMIPVNVEATNLNANETRYEGESGQSGLNYTLVNKNGAVSGAESTYFSPSDDAAKKYEGNDLGCVYTKESTTFKVWSPTASKVTLCRYTKGTAEEAGSKLIEEKEMTKDSQNVWSCKVDGDIVNTYYTYKVTNNGNTSEAVDIYAKAVGANGKRAMVVDLDSTDPENWDTDYKRSPQRISDVITWEVHVNDFSNQGSKAGFSDEYKGKYLAFSEDGTKLSGTDYETGIAYLKKLGITHVQIMPMYDYGSVDETKAGQTDSNYNWGYDPVNFNAPEGSYSTNPYDGNVRIKEMKQMIQALHDAGIKVIMDVVYNHTYCKDGQEMAFFDDIVPGYYYRSDSKGYTNGSGCGNEVRTQAYMANKFIRESMLYWASEYNLDGFRLDLMGLYDTTTMKDIRNDMDAAFGKDNIVIYGEGWGCMVTPSYGAGKWNSWTLADSNIGLFNDSGRDCIHGTANADHVGQIGMLQQNISTGKGTEGDKYPLSLYGMLQGAAGRSQDQWWMWRAYCFKNSDQSVSYSSCHDNMALWDKLAETISDNGTLVKLNKMNAGILFSCHGGTFIQAGEEFGRSKDGIENSYSSGARVNQLDWTRVKDYQEIVDFYKGMIAIRKAFSGFRTVYTSASENLPANNTNGGFQTVGNNNMTNVEGFNDCSNRVIHKIGFYLSNNVSGEWNKIAVLMNNDTTDATATLSGASSWVLVSNGKKASVEGVETVNGNNITVPGKSVVVAVPKDTFDANPNPGASNQNSAPTISVDSTSISVNPGETVSFQVTTKDADGDTVTVSCTGLPEGAAFDPATGMFNWESAVIGTYAVKLKATDGTVTTEKTVTITVADPSDSLKQYVKEIEEEQLAEADFTAKTWTDLNTALTNAKAANENTSAEELANLKSALEKAHKAAKAEKDANAALTTSLAEAKKAYQSADTEANDAALLSDMDTVIKEAEALLTSKGTVVAYIAAKENLEDCVNSLAQGEAGGKIYVSTTLSNPHIYAWKGSGDSATKLLGKWPGTALTEKDANGQFVIDCDTTGTYNIIINDGTKSGGAQTADIENVSGVVTIKVESTGADNGTNVIHKHTVECKAAGVSTPKIFKTSLEAAIEKAGTFQAQYYTEESFATLQSEITKAQGVVDKTDATQLAINQAARTLRAAYVGLVVKNNVTLPDETEEPDVTETPTAGTPTPGNESTPVPGTSTEPTVSNEPDLDNTPEVGTHTNAPIVSENPGNTIAPNSSDDPDRTMAPGSTNAVTNTNAPGNIDLAVTDAPSGQTQAPATQQPTATSSSAPVNPTSTPAAETKSLQITSFQVSPETYQVLNQDIRAKVEATGGTGSLQYKFEVISGEVVIEKQDYSTETSFVYNAEKVGTLRIRVTVKDGTDEVSEEEKIVVVSKKLAIKIKQKIRNNKPGKKTVLTLQVAGTGGKAPYKYKYVITNAKGKTLKMYGYSSVKNRKLSLSKKGTYKIKVFVKDSLGVVTTKTVSIRKK